MYKSAPHSIQQNKVFILSSIIYLSLGWWTYVRTEGLIISPKGGTISYKVCMNVIYLLMMDAYWIVFQSNSAAMRNYHWKINYNFLILVVICLFLGDQSIWVRLLALVGHIITMSYVHQRTKHARFFFRAMGSEIRLWQNNTFGLICGRLSGPIPLTELGLHIKYYICALVCIFGICKLTTTSLRDSLDILLQHHLS